MKLHSDVTWDVVFVVESTELLACLMGLLMVVVLIILISSFLCPASKEE